MESFMKNMLEGIMGNIHVKFRPVVQEEMLFKEKVNGRTMDKDRSQLLTLRLWLR